MKNETIKKYLVEIKGIGQNDNCWEIKGVFDRLAEALEHYNFFTSGCEKRVRETTTTLKNKIIAKKRY